MTNASGTMTRRASELDTGSRVVYDGQIRTVAAVQDIFYSDRVITTFRFTDGTSSQERARTLVTCVA